MAQIQIATGREGPSVGSAGQPALQAGVRGQNQQPPARSGRALQAAVKRSFSNLISGLFLLFLVEKAGQGNGKRKEGLESERQLACWAPGRHKLWGGEMLCEVENLLTCVPLKLQLEKLNGEENAKEQRGQQKPPAKV